MPQSQLLCEAGYSLDPSSTGRRGVGVVKQSYRLLGSSKIRSPEKEAPQELNGEMLTLNFSEFLVRKTGPHLQLDKWRLF